HTTSSHLSHTPRSSLCHHTRSSLFSPASPMRPSPSLCPPRSLLVSAADATDSGLAPASVDRPPSSSRADPSPDTSPSPREEAETDDAAGSHSVGGFGPGPNSNVRSFVRLSLASLTAAASQKYPRSTWMSISQSERLGA